jgi:hypothetical protein
MYQRSKLLFKASYQSATGHYDRQPHQTLVIGNHQAILPVHVIANHI